MTKDDSEALEPAYSPGGTSIAFRRGPNLFTMRADDSETDQLTNLDEGQGNNIHPSLGR